MTEKQETSTVLPKLILSPCTFVSVHDGDTFRMSVPIEAGIPTVTWTPNIRLAHVNAAEISTADGKMARDLVQAWFAPHKTFTLIMYGPDKYGRTVGDVALDSGELLSTFVAGIEGTVPMQVHRQLLHA